MTSETMLCLQDDLRAAAMPSDATPMAAYMRDRFPYLGVKTPPRRAATKILIRSTDVWDPSDVVAFVDECWQQPEREFQYVGCDIVCRQAHRFDSAQLPDLRRWISTKSWWDTVDVLAAHGVGTVTRSDPACADEMEGWVLESDIWVARTAILHQLRWKHDTNADRLFRFVLTRAAEKEFFLRKAAGWALREYAKVAPGDVRGFVADHDSELSALTRREALKHF